MGLEHKPKFHKGWEAEEKVKLSLGYPLCPKCGYVMDSDVELDDNHKIIKEYFFCWNDKTTIDREASVTQQQTNDEKQCFI